MSDAPPPPLSSTVALILAEFLKKIENEKALSVESTKALQQAFTEQKFDPETLRKAIFTAGEPTQ
jgi:hypothetical protein